MLKILHLLAVSLWVGGLLCNIVVNWALPGARSGDELYGMLRAMSFVNIFVVVYLGTFGSFFTGLAYSICTNRGFFRHKWIIIKWMLTIGLMLCGKTLLAPWSTGMLEMAHTHGLNALHMDIYREFSSRLLFMHCFQFGILVLMFVLSVYKPWEPSESIAQPMMRRR